jgi:hypothetical protein
MIRHSLIALILLSTSACVTQPVRDESPASDLHATLREMERALPKRNLANGKLYCIEDAVTQQQHDECDLDLEDNVFVREQDRIEALALLRKAVRRIELARNPCGFFKRVFNRSACE